MKYVEEVLPGDTFTGRSPHGERGLKSVTAPVWVGETLSLPSRGAWIEITLYPLPVPRLHSRSPHGERGLKSAARRLHSIDVIVAPLTGSVD